MRLGVDKSMGGVSVQGAGRGGGMGRASCRRDEPEDEKFWISSNSMVFRINRDVIDRTHSNTFSHRNVYVVLYL